MYSFVCKINHQFDFILFLLDNELKKEGAQKNHWRTFFNAST